MANMSVARMTGIAVTSRTFTYSFCVTDLFTVTGKGLIIDKCIKANDKVKETEIISHRPIA